MADKHHSRPSHEAGYTGSTATYEHPNKPLHSGYHTAPTGGAVNPYGYDNTQPHHTPATTATNY